MLSTLLSNWKTSTAGLVVIGVAVLETFGVDVPGFNMSIGEAVALGLGLLVGKDMNVTGGTKPQ